MKAYAAQRFMGAPAYYTAEKLAEHFDGRDAGAYIIDGAKLVGVLETKDGPHRIGPWEFWVREDIEPRHVFGAENTTREEAGA